MAEELKEKLVVRNFGPITNLDIEIRPLTLFIGTQGSGKSTVAKLLTICRDLRWWLRILDEDDVMRPFYDFSINEYFQDDSYFYYSIMGVVVKYEKQVFSFQSEEWEAQKIRDQISYSNSKIRFHPTSPLIGTNERLSKTIL